MNFTGVVMLSLLVIVPLTMLIGLAMWARWLWKRTSASRWMVALPAVLAVLVSIPGLAFGIYRGAGAIGGDGIDPSQKARGLAEGISEVMNSGALGMLLAIVAALWLLGLTWRHRWSSSKAKGANR